MVVRSEAIGGDNAGLDFEVEILEVDADLALSSTDLPAPAAVCRLSGVARREAATRVLRAGGRRGLPASGSRWSTRALGPLRFKTTHEIVRKLLSFEHTFDTMRHGPAALVPDTAATAALVDVQRTLTALTTPDTVLSEAELVEQLRALEDAKATLCAAQATLTVRLDRTVRARHARARVPAAQQGRDVAGLLAYARRESPATGTRLLGLAHALAEQPHTHAAMSTGVLSEWRATLISRETACLSREDRAALDAQVSAPRPDGTHPFAGWGDRRLVAEVQKLVIALDPEAVVNRRSRAEADRHLTLRPAPDTMARLSALLPAAQGVAIWATLTRIADQARTAGDPRSRGQVMADTLVERITGQTRADAVPITVNLVISDQTLLAGDHQPAWLQGYGPVPADTIDPEAFTALRTLYATPTTGTLVAMESAARAFPTNLARFLDLRDRTCRTPYCDAPIRHHDHAHDHTTGGPTTATNGQGLCEHCNHTKQAPGWRSRPATGPPGQPHTIETTLPTGHTTRVHRTRDPTTQQAATHQPRRDPPQPDRPRVRRLSRRSPQGSRTYAPEASVVTRTLVVGQLLGGAMTTNDLDRILRDLETGASSPRCECEHDPGPTQCPSVAAFAATIVCSEPGCQSAVEVYLLCAACMATWRSRSAEQGAPRLRVRRL